MRVAVCLSLVFVAVSLTRLATALRFGPIQMPALVQRSGNFWLVCQFELDTDSSEQLYSVKWYKNNEEFYRLLLSGSASLSSSSSLPAAGAGEQQHFSVPGVNVMMSQSNATHVRLLNASLESDGSYACEISTQNLSTIREEREIRVYVLPSAKLQLSGLKSRYTLNERLELYCSSDFARPLGSLGWLINGRQVPTSAASSSQFELRMETSSKSNEPQLRRIHSRLKFRLSPELLGDFLEAQHPSGSGHDQSLSAAARALLKIECKYKQTEVSDVTFSELLVMAAPLAQSPAQDGRKWAEEGELDEHDGGGGDEEEMDAERERRQLLTNRRDDLRHKQRLHSGGGQSIYRNSDNQIVVSVQRSRSDSSSRLRSNNFQQILAQMGASPLACRLGPAANLDGQDPVILAKSLLAGERKKQKPSRRESLKVRGKQLAGPALRVPSDLALLELPLDSNLSVNCLTLSALETADSGGRLEDVLPSKLVFEEEEQEQEQATEESAKQLAGYCNDTLFQRRSLISGKYQNKDSAADSLPALHQQHPHHLIQRPAASKQRKQDHNLVAYLSLNGKESLAAILEASTRRGNNDWPSARTRHPPQGAPASSSAADLALGGGESAKRGGGGGLELLAPPLLEWFINNQEAPDSSVRYGPELPLVAPSGDQQRARLVLGSPEDASDQQQRTTDRPSQAQLRALALPSIDYQEYFANLANRPLQQRLELTNLRLEKRLFETSDSLLRLRCSSTKALVLATDSISFGLYAVAASTNDTREQPSQPMAVDQLEDQLQPEGQQLSAGSVWHRKRPAQQTVPTNRYYQRQANQTAQKQQRTLAARQPGGRNGVSSLKTNNCGPWIWMLSIAICFRFALALEKTVILN